MHHPVETNLQHLKNDAKKEIDKAEDLLILDKIFRRYLGKKGEIHKIFKTLKNSETSEKREIGREINLVKAEIEAIIRQKKQTLQKKLEQTINRKAKIDVTQPGEKVTSGHLHPLTLVRREIIQIFQSMGFEIVEGPEIESEWYNFNALNIPPDHPARDVQDTLWLKTKDRALLRTHTSSIQIHYMEKHKPPFKIIAPGERVFRHEATDASHEVNFYQVEVLMVDERGKINVANLKAIIETFSRCFFEKSLKIRLRPSYFPFTEPSFEVDVSCPICGGKGCSTCQYSGWVETIGAGMIHPNVFKNSGLNPKKWQGFAFGIGLDRLAMLKYRIPDIRLFYANDLRFLNQF